MGLYLPRLLQQVITIIRKVFDIKVLCKEQIENINFFPPSTPKAHPLFLSCRENGWVGGWSYSYPLDEHVPESSP